MLSGMPPAHVVSVNVGAPRPTTTNSAGRTGIDKRPVEALDVRASGPKRGGLGSGVVGDFIGEVKHHGGDTQAVYLFAREELDHWVEQLGRPLRPGIFGENVTTSGLAVDAMTVGQRLGIGDAVVLRVCGPRIPCRTFAAHMGVPGWVRRFTARGRSGAYCAVDVPGTIRPGDAITVLDEPDHGIDVSVVFAAFMGDLDQADRVLQAGCLHPQEHRDLATSVARRRRGA